MFSEGKIVLDGENWSKYLFSQPNHPHNYQLVAISYIEDKGVMYNVPEAGATILQPDSIKTNTQA